MFIAASIVHGISGSRHQFVQNGSDSTTAAEKIA
jgi:hypothetical protein